MNKKQILASITGEYGFPNFVRIVWAALDLPEPTPVQLDIAYNLQHGPKRHIIEAFRGVGKSYITSAYVVWRLLLDPQTRIMVVSASKGRADRFTTFTLDLITRLGSLTEHLKPRPGQTCSKVAFDVGPAVPDQSNSVISQGITGQLTGSRADVIVADDIESWNNSQTPGMRESIHAAVAEFESIIKPVPEARIIFLGTPQTEDSLYNKLAQQNYDLDIWTARVPASVDAYSGRLAEYVVKMTHTHKEGDPVDPDRFDNEDLYERELSMGRSAFALQFQLDTSFSDLDRYPLKLSDLCVMDVDSEVVPEKVVYGKSPAAEIKDITCWGLGSDRFYLPMNISQVLMKPSFKVMAIDPSGRGSDETSYSVVSTLYGQFFIHRCNGLQGGYSDEVLDTLTEIANEEGVKEIFVESNMGDGMFTNLLEKTLATKGYKIKVSEIHNSTNKERRIIGSLEPLLNSHKIIMGRNVLEEDLNTIKKYPREKQRFYSLQYQLSRITKDKGSLKHDDRLEALQMGVQALVDFARQDVDTELSKKKEREFEERLKRVREGNLLGKKGKSNYHSWL